MYFYQINNKFKSYERLKSKKNIKNIFHYGIKYYIGCIKIIYIKLPYNNNNLYNKICIAIPKNKIKKAIDRNLLKRRIRHIFRENKNIIINNKNIYYIIFIYIKNKIYTFQKIKKYIIYILNYLSKK